MGGSEVTRGSLCYAIIRHQASVIGFYGADTDKVFLTTGCLCKQPCTVEQCIITLDNHLVLTDIFLSFADLILTSAVFLKFQWSNIEQQLIKTKHFN